MRKWTRSTLLWLVVRFGLCSHIWLCLRWSSSMPAVDRWPRISAMRSACGGEGDEHEHCHCAASQRESGRDPNPEWSGILTASSAVAMLVERLPSLAAISACAFL